MGRGDWNGNTHNIHHDELKTCIWFLLVLLHSSERVGTLKTVTTTTLPSENANGTKRTTHFWMNYIHFWINYKFLNELHIFLNKLHIIAAKATNFCCEYTIKNLANWFHLNIGVAVKWKQWLQKRYKSELTLKTFICKKIRPCTWFINL